MFVGASSINRQSRAKLSAMRTHTHLVLRLFVAYLLHRMSSANESAASTVFVC